MKLIKLSLMVAALAVFTSLNVSAQQDRPNRGNFDPEQFREQMMSRIREQMDVKDDAEWKLISERITKVMEARREVGMGGGGMAAFGRGRGRGEGNGQGGQGGGGGGQGGGGNRRGGPGGFGAPSPEAESLQKAIEAKASADEIKGKLEKYREARKAKHEKLEKAQGDLQKVLSVKQEAVAVMNNLLD